MTAHQMKRLIALVLILIVIGGGGLFALGYTTYYLFTKPKDSKYIIYAADKKYHANEFTVTGRTIYFKDCLSNKNVCINGEYTLIYEKSED